MKKYFILLMLNFLLSSCTSALQPQANDLSQQLQNIPVKIIAEQNDVRIMLPWKSSQELKILAAVIKTLQDYPDTHVKIVGYSSQSHHERRNIMASEQRAKEIAHYIVKHHIKPRRVESQGLGSAGQTTERHAEIILYQRKSNVDATLLE